MTAKFITDYLRRFKREHRIIRRISLTVTIFAITTTIITGVFTWLMSRVPEYRLQMQAWISEHARLDVQFAELHARWYRFGPQLEFTDAVVRSRDGKRVLVFARNGSLGFDLWTAIRTARLTALQFSLQGTELKAIRKSNGVFEIIGQADIPEYEHAESFDLNSLPVGEFTIRDVRLVFRDLKTRRGPWIVDNLDFNILRDNDSIDVQGQATLPNMLGKQLTFHASGKGGLDDAAQLQWHASVAGTDLNLKGWTQVMPDDWIAPREGLGSFALSADFVGAHLHSFAGDINFENVLMRLPAWKLPLPVADTLHLMKDDADSKSARSDEVATAVSTVSNASAVPFKYSTVKVAFNTLLTTDGWQTHFSNVQFSHEGTEWQPSSANLLVKFADVKDTGTAVATNADDSSNREHHVIEQLTASAQLIVLDNLWPLLAYLPETEQFARVRALNGTGRLEKVAVRYERDLSANAVTVGNSNGGTTGSDADSDTIDVDANEIVALRPPRYSFRADFKELGVSPVGRIPGATGVSGTVEASGARGKLHLDSVDAELAIPRIFRTPLPIDHVTGNFNWTRSSAGTQLASNDLIIQSPNGNAQAQFTLNIPAQGSAQIDMHANATDLEVASAPRYMPAGVMASHVLSWLDAAFVGGHVKQAQLTLQGPLQKFPFRDNEGLFLITADIDDLLFNYQSGWMPADHLQIQAEFRNAGFSGKVLSGQLNGLSIDSASGGIEDFHDSQLRVKGAVHGELDQALRYVQQSPVGPAIGSLFQQVNGHGTVHAQATLSLPLKDLTKRQVDIDAQLQDATIGLNDVNQHATNVQGSLHIANDAVTAVDLGGQFLQGALSATAMAVDRNHSNVVVNGKAAAAPLAEFLRLPAFVKINGDMRYRFSAPGYAQRDAEGQRHLFTVDSDLVGLQLDLPAPVSKPATVPRPIHLDADMRGENTMQLRGSLEDLRTLIRLQHAGDGWHFDRAGLRVDAVAAALPSDPGLRIEGSMPEFTLDDWLRLGNGNDKNVAGGAAIHVQDILRAANVNIGKFHLYGFEWPDVRAVLQAADTDWRVDVASAQATGQVTVPYAFDALRPLIVDMENLTLSPRPDNDGKVAANVSADKAARMDPRDLPALQVNIKEFHFGEHDFGALQAHALRDPQGLQVDNIEFGDDSFKGNGSGSWIQTSTGSLTNVTLAIDSTDVRKTMQQLHYADFISGKHGRLQADLSWPDGLDADLLGRASGSLELQMDEGQLLNLQPGAGRVLGLLSIAALPRRLRLDFHDVTDKGLAFDSIHGTFDVKNGNATTSNLLLRGPTAEIGIAGRIGLGARDYDQTAVVTGDVGSALPVAGVALVNPVVGAALLVFSQIFKEPLKGVARAYYHIGGSWDDPQVERVDSVVGRASMLNTATSSSSSAASSSSSAAAH